MQSTSFWDEVQIAQFFCCCNYTIINLKIATKSFVSLLLIWTNNRFSYNLAAFGAFNTQYLLPSQDMIDMNAVIFMAHNAPLQHFVAGVMISAGELYVLLASCSVTRVAQQP